MARIVSFPINPPAKLGLKKARKRKRLNLEDYGQLNLFTDTTNTGGRVVSLPKNQSFFEEALSLDEAGKSDEAERYYLLAAEHDQSKGDAFCNLGIIKYSHAQHPEAVNYLTKCLEIVPRHFEAHYNLGNIYTDLGNLSLASIHYKISIEIQPDYPDAHYNLGLVMISQKDYKTAISQITQYLELSPEGDHRTALELIETLKDIAK